MDVRDCLRHTKQVMLFAPKFSFKKSLLYFFLLFSVSLHSSAQTSTSSTSEAEVKKTHIEDIFIWKMSDELKLTAKEEKSFTEILKKLNKLKSNLNKNIQLQIEQFNDNTSEVALRAHRKLIAEYNQISLNEFDQVKKLLGTKKFVQYLQIKNEISNKMKSILVGEKASDKSTDKKENNIKLPKPKVIVEKPD